MNPPDTLLTDDHLRAQVKLLGTLLGQVLLQFAGEEVFETVETLRRGFAELQQQEDQQRRTELMEMIDAMPAHKVELVVRAFSSYFKLVNVAEERWMPAQDLIASLASPLSAHGHTIFPPGS